MINTSCLNGRKATLDFQHLKYVSNLYTPCVVEECFREGQTQKVHFCWGRSLPEGSTLHNWVSTLCSWWGLRRRVEATGVQWRGFGLCMCPVSDPPWHQERDLVSLNFGLKSKWWDDNYRTVQWSRSNWPQRNKVCSWKWSAPQSMCVLCLSPSCFTEAEASGVGRWWCCMGRGLWKWVMSQISGPWGSGWMWVLGLPREALILWPPDVKSWVTEKDWRQKKRAAEEEMVGWHHWLNRHEFEQTLGDSEGQGSLACCSPWGL